MTDVGVVNNRRPHLAVKVHPEANPPEDRAERLALALLQSQLPIRGVSDLTGALLQIQLLHL